MDEPGEQPTEDKAPSELEEIHAQAMAAFDATVMAEQDERSQALEDRRFVTIAGAQWEGAWGEQFENSIRTEIDKTVQGVERIVSDYRANRIIVNFRAVGKGSSEDTAETLNGMFRADFYRSHGQQIVDNAFEEAVQGGYGAWRLTNEYVDEGDPDNDEQQISFKLIPDADQSVFWFGGRLYDKSDAWGCVVLSALTPDEFKAEYGEDRITSWPDGIPNKPMYDWFQPEIVRVAEFYRVENKTEWADFYEHRATGEARRIFRSEGEDSALLETEGWRLLRSRKIKRRRIRKLILSGAEVLEDKGHIAGDQIPVIPVYGKRSFVDNVERVRGHVRKAKDPQRVYNAQIAKLTETAALAPIERPILHPEQVAGHEQSWAEANINRAPYSLINPMIGPGGETIASGPVGSISPPQLSPVLAALIQQTNADIAELTNSQDEATNVKSNVSAEAMDIAATRIDAKSSIFMDNFKLSMKRCGEVILSMYRDVMVEEGREVETMGDKGELGTAILQEPYTDESGAHSIRNDIANGQYKVIAEITEATATRRDKTVRSLTAGAQIVQAFDPELAGAMMNTAVLNLDGEGMDDLQEWVRQRMVQQGVVKPTDEEQRAMEEAAENAQPDPTAEAMLAQAEALKASAGKDRALTQKAAADTELSRAKAVETLAKARETRANGVVGRITGLFGRKPNQQQPGKQAQ